MLVIATTEAFRLHVPVLVAGEVNIPFGSSRIPNLIVTSMAETGEALPPADLQDDTRLETEDVPGGSKMSVGRFPLGRDNPRDIR